jgi:hypothetical protein
MLKSRVLKGISRYETVLCTWNGRSAIRDAKEEAIDLWQYLSQIEEEWKDVAVLLDRITTPDRVDISPYPPGGMPRQYVLALSEQEYRQLRCMADRMRESCEVCDQA